AKRTAHEFEQFRIARDRARDVELRLRVRRLDNVLRRRRHGHRSVPHLRGDHGHAGSTCQVVAWPWTESCVMSASRALAAALRRSMSSMPPLSAMNVTGSPTIASTWKAGGESGLLRSWSGGGTGT